MKLRLNESRTYTFTSFYFTGNGQRFTLYLHTGHSVLHIYTCCVYRTVDRTIVVQQVVWLAR
jgi:hypothetical protein